jgi:hypothetical protein
MLNTSAQTKATEAEIALLRKRAARFLVLATNAPLDQHRIAERLLLAAADLDAKAIGLELERSKS